MSLTGFDPSVVSTSINAVIKAYNDLMQALGTDMQKQFIGGMSDKWACNEAKDFFSNAFKPSIDSLIHSSDSIFESVVKAMNSAAQSWAERTKSSYSSIPFTPKNIKMDVSPIAENIGGVRGIDYQNAGNVAARLQTIAQSASVALVSAQSAVQQCGFMGGSQAQSLINSLGIIRNKIKSSTDDITNQTKSAIDATVANYGDLAGQVSKAFSASE